MTGSPRLWWVDLLAGLRTKEAATRLAAHFVLTVDDEHKRDIWGPAAKDLLCALFLVRRDLRPYAARSRPLAR